MITERLISAKEAAQILGLGKSTIWRWVSEGKLPPPIKLGPRTTRWKLSEVVAVIESQSETTH